MRVKPVIVLLILANAAGLYADEKRWNWMLEDDSTPKGKIVGGEATEPYEYPWHVQIRYRGVHWCGGTLINSRSVLTAAHCMHEMGVVPLHKDELEIYGREHNIYCLEGAEQRRGVESYRVHPDYDPHTLQNDIAVIRVNPAFKPDRLLKTIRWPKKEIKFIVNTTKAEIVGWGWLRYPAIRDGEHFILPPATLRKASLLNYADVQCALRTHIASGVNLDLLGSVCFYGGDDVSSCTGDSGGGAVCRTDGGQAFLCGIVSWSVRCGQKATQNIFVRLWKFIPWIETNSNPTGLQPLKFTKCGSYFHGSAAVFDFKYIKRDTHCHIVIESDFVESTIKITGVFDAKDDIFVMKASNIRPGFKPRKLDPKKVTNTVSLRGSSIIIVSFRIARWSFAMLRNITINFNSKGARAVRDPVTDLNIIDYVGEINYPEKDSGTEWYYNSRHVLLVFPRYYNGEYYEANFTFRKLYIDGGLNCDEANLTFLHLSVKGEFESSARYCSHFNEDYVEMRVYGILIIRLVSTPDALFGRGVTMIHSARKGGILDSWTQ